MSVLDITPIKSHVYTGVGVYEFDFKTYLSTDLVCTVLMPDGSTRSLVKDTDYSVSIAADPLVGGSVTLLTDSNPTAIKLYILREMPFTQEVDWENGGPLDQPLLTRSMDKITMLLQQMRTTVSGYIAQTVWRGSWATGVGYVERDLLLGPNGSLYTVVSAHTSGVFATDLAAGRLALVLDKVAIVAEISALTMLPDPSTGQPEQAVIVNPTGTGYVLGDGSGGLKWLTYSTSQTAVKGKGYAMDTTAGALTVTPPATPAVGDSFGVADLAGTFDTNNCTVALTGLKLHGVVQTEGMTLDVENQRVVFSYTGATQGWIITDLVPLGQAWEYMPYAVMHVQNRQNQNTNIAGWPSGDSTMVLNYVAKNDIAGASLAGNQITLPAGDYEVLGDIPASCDTTSSTVRFSLKTVSGIELAVAQTFEYNGAAFQKVPMIGSFTLPVETTLYLNVWGETAYTSTGYPVQSNRGPEVYTNLKITKIGGNYAPKPVISAARLQPMAGVVPNCQVQGFEITNTGTNQLTVTKGQCLDSTLTTAIAVTGNTVLALDTTNNKLFTVAAVILNNGTHTCKVYDSEAAMAADVGVNVTHVAYIGWWQNNGSGQAKAGRLFGAADGLAELWWMKASENAVTSKVAPPANCNTAVSLASYLPSSDRVIGVLPGSQASSADTWICVGTDGTNVVGSFVGNINYTSDNDLNAFYAIDRNTPPWLACVNNVIYWGDGTYSNSGTADIRLHATRFRR